MPTGFVDYRDVAEVAAIALTCDRLTCGSFELCAEPGLDRHAITAMMSNEAGVPIEAAEQTPEEWPATTAFPETDREKGLLAKMYAYYDVHGFTRADSYPWAGASTLSKLHRRAGIAR